MSKQRKDSKGRVLKTGEYERPNSGTNSRFQYEYTNAAGKRVTIYASDIQELRMKEDEISYNRHDGIDIITAKMTTVDELFDRYISLKHDLKDNVKANYLYMYDHFVRGNFGARKISDIKYSDVKEFYYTFLNENRMKASTLDNINSILHPTFCLAIRDGLMRSNPTEGVMCEIKKGNYWKKDKPKALTEDQVTKLFDFIKNSDEYKHWYNFLAVLYGTGMRIGEMAGIRWEDIDMDNNVISVNHNVVYYKHADGKFRLAYHDFPKTEAGIRSIPMFDFVRTAIEDEYALQKEIGFCDYELDGYSGFVFYNRDGRIHIQTGINRAIDRIVEAYNKNEIINSVKNNRTPKLIPHFSCHNLRHTICARLCENEDNMKFIQEFMGHKDVTTTMDVYAEFGQQKKQEKVKGLNGAIGL